VVSVPVSYKCVSEREEDHEVVPEGSFQMENSINWSVGQGSNVLDGSETSLRFGIRHCMELLLDAPNYVYSLNGPSASGFAEPVLSLKYQLGALPDRYQLPVTAGLGVPIGAKKVSNHGPRSKRF
jgi:hypothetical protein